MKRAITNLEFPFPVFFVPKNLFLILFHRFLSGSVFSRLDPSIKPRSYRAQSASLMKTAKDRTIELQILKSIVFFDFDCPISYPLPSTRTRASSAGSPTSVIFSTVDLTSYSTLRNSYEILCWTTSIIK